MDFVLICIDKDYIIKVIKIQSFVWGDNTNYKELSGLIMKRGFTQTLKETLK